MSGTSILSYLILTLAIGYSFIYPSWSDINALMDEKGKYQESLAKTERIESKKDELLAQVDKMSDEDKKNIETVVPNSFNSIKLISDIDAVASRRGISIKNINFERVNSAAGESINTAEAPSSHQSALVGFSFTSSYEDFRGFLDDLEKSMRILDIKSLDVMVGEKGGFDFKVKFETYWLE